MGKKGGSKKKSEQVEAPKKKVVAKKAPPAAQATATQRPRPSALASIAPSNTTASPVDSPLTAEGGGMQHRMPTGTPLSTLLGSDVGFSDKMHYRSYPTGPDSPPGTEVPRREHVSCKSITLGIIIILIVAKLTGAYKEVVKTVIPSGMLVEHPTRPGLTYYADFPRVLEDHDEGFAQDQKKENNRPHHRQRRGRRQEDDLHPVVVVPGFLGTALEMWETEECLKSNLTSVFRQRVFSPQMMVELLQNPRCFLKHLALGPYGEDPTDDIRVRPSEGPDGADYIIPGFWIFAKLFINLVDIELEPSQLHVAGYDWRLDPEGMQNRDGYFSRLKNQIEYMVRRTKLRGKNGEKKKVVVAVHSYGALVFTAFVKWIEDGGDQTAEQAAASREHPDRNLWMDEHVEAFYNMGGPLLGLPKASAGILSGEFRDTAMLPATAKILVNAQVPLRRRAKVWRSWSSLQYMQPRIAELFSGLLSVRNEGSELGYTPQSSKNLTLQQSLQLLGDVASASEQEDVKERLAHVATGNNDLPVFPKKKMNMKVYCVRGVNYPTEVGFHYRNVSQQKPIRVAGSLLDLVDELDASTLTDKLLHSTPAETLRRLVGREENWVASSASLAPADGASDPVSHPQRREDSDELQPDDQFYEIDAGAPNHGVKEDSGDATVPLMSLGYLCHSDVVGWRTVVDDPDKNVVSVEIENHRARVAEGKHAPMDPRGGDHTGDHVDMLGNKDVITDLLHVVSGQSHLVQSKVISDISDRTVKTDSALLKRLKGTK